jgi:hypothetical protein
MRHALLGAAAGLVLLCGTARGQCTPLWIPLPAGSHPNDWVYTLKAWDPDGPGPAREILAIGGNFTQPASHLASWNGVSLSVLGGGTSGTVLSLGHYVAPGGSPELPHLIAGGVFWHAGGVSSRPIAGWDGGQWYAMSGIGHTSTAVTWPNVQTIQQFGTELFASGIINLVNGQPSGNMAQWNGTSWSASPNPLFSFDLHVFGGELYSAGAYEIPGNPPLKAGVLRWDGSNWVTMGTNYPPTCEALITWRGMLIAGGWNSLQVPNWHNIAAWDGQNWLPLGTGTNAFVRALAVFDPDGAGPMPELLIAGGGFTVAGGLSAVGIAAWDGMSWQALGPGVDGAIEALEVYDNQLYLGGRFYHAGGMVSPGLARWGCPQPPPPPACYANCDQSTSAPVLNVDDFMCFINEFGAGISLPHSQQVEHYANCDGSTIAPALNVDDFMCFINRFGAGCR